MLGTKEEELTGDWRKLHSEDLNDLYFYPNAGGIISRKMGVSMWYS